MPSTIKTIITLFALLLIWMATLFFRKTPIERDLSGRVESALNQAEFKAVSVTFEGRDCTLTGALASRAYIHQAETLARQVWGVRTVENQLAVVPGEPQVPVEEEKPTLKDGFDSLLDSIVIEFPSESARLDVRAEGILKRVAEYLKKLPDERVEIQGHTDSSGNDRINVPLSEARVKAVKTVLVNGGIASTRLATRAFAATKPLADNSTDEGRQRNRRVVFKKLGNRKNKQP